MKIAEIGFVVYPVTSLAKARPFYEDVLGLKPTMVHEGNGRGWVEYDIGGGTLALGSGTNRFKPGSGGGCVALEVENFDEAVAHLRTSGATFTVEPTETPVCHLAGVSDPDGNTLIVHHRKPR